MTRWGPQPFLSDLGRGDGSGGGEKCCVHGHLPMEDPWCVHIFLKKKDIKNDRTVNILRIFMDFLSPMGVSENGGHPGHPEIIFLNRLFHEINHPAIGVPP